EVTMLERHSRAAAEASGNPAGLFHAVAHAGDGPYARLYRAAALRAHTVYSQAIDRAGVPGNARGLLRIVPPPDDLKSMQALLARSGLPTSHLQALDRHAASALAGVALHHPAWFYPGGGWIDPGAWVQQALAQPGVRLVVGAAVARVSAGPDDPADPRWIVHGDNGAVLARAAVVVLAPGAAGTSLAPMRWPLSRSRGQLTYWTRSHSEPTPLRIALAGAGYALPLAGGGLVCGATHDPAADADDLERDPPVRRSDHQYNLQRLLSLCGLQPPPDAVLQDRAAWRLQSADRLPIAGAVSLDAGEGSRSGRRDQARLLPRARGLFVLTALGSRGLTWAPLLAELIAAQACGAPWPLTQDLADAVDPARWAVRAARSPRGHRSGPEGPG
ncbi:MAG: FAD-dependent 5-carboxymethylaminomethyl-2-thiouridine(34) oxidoreductase MnmC, partial [Rubrivivax sp.]